VNIDLGTVIAAIAGACTVVAAGFAVAGDSFILRRVNGKYVRTDLWHAAQQDANERMERMESMMQQILGILMERDRR
jgi:hypothetical protein